MRTDAHSPHEDKVCSFSRSKMQWWSQISQKACVQILQKVLSHTEVSLTGSNMAALLFVGWLCTEECTGNGGGSLWLSQTKPDSFYFLSITLQLSPLFPSGLGPDLDHQYSCCDSVPLRQWPSSRAFSKYWISYCPHQRLGESDHWSDLLLSFLYAVVAAGERQNFFCVSCFQSMEIFVCHSN